MSTAAPDDGVRARILSGLAWKVASQFVLQGSRIVVAVILARLLSPEDYGIAGMALVLSSLVLIFSDLALGAALIQRKHLTDADKSTVFWTGVGAGLLFTLLGIALSGPVADFYGEPEVQPLFAAMSISFVITALATVQTALLTREMNFRSLELRMMAATLVGAIVGIAAAVTGWGAWAIILQQLVVSTLSTILLWHFSDWRPRFVFSRESLRDLGGFSGYVFGTRVLFYANRTADSVLIGRFLGPAALGAYAIATTAILFPFNQIAGPIQEVLYPAFSKMQDDPDRMGAAWIRVNRLVGAFSIPALVGLIITAPDFVPVVLGSKWNPAVPVIQILAWVGLMQSLQRLNSSILQARDRTSTLFRYAIVVLVASLIGFVGGLHWGIVGVAVGYAISSTVVEPYYTSLTARSLNLTLWSFLRAFSGVLQATLVMTAVLLVTRAFLVSEGVPAAARLVLLVLLGTATYLLASLWSSRDVISELKELIRMRRASRMSVAES